MENNGTTARSRIVKLDAREYIKENLRMGAMIIALILLWIGFGVATDGNFTSIRNISNVLRQMTVLGIMGCGMVLVIASENIDLSVGSAMGFISVLAAYLMRVQEWGVASTIATAIIVGIAIGLLNGVIIAYLQVPSFIVTLGSLFIYRGALYGVGRGVSISPLPEVYQVIGQGSISTLFGYVLAGISVLVIIGMHLSNRQSRLNYDLPVESIITTVIKVIVYSFVVVGIVHLLNQWKGIPLPLLVTFIVVLIFTFIAQKTPFGRRVYAIGFNKIAAKYAGLNVKRTIATVFMLNGLLAGVSAIIYSSRLNAGIPTAGETMELDVIAAAIIGGASLTGGVGKVWGAILGALIMATVSNGMSILDVKYYYLFIVKGAVIIAAVWFDVYTKKRMA